MADTHSLIPPTRVSITAPLPTTASTRVEDGKLHLAFEIDLAGLIGRAMLDGTQPDLATVATAITMVTKDLFAAVAAARQVAKGSA